MSDNVEAHAAHCRVANIKHNNKNAQVTFFVSLDVLSENTHSDQNLMHVVPEE